VGVAFCWVEMVAAVDARGQLLELIYESVLEPNLWVTVMERCADLMGAAGGCVTRISVADGDGTALLARTDPAFLQLYRDYYASLNLFAVRPEPQAYMAGWIPRVTTDIDFISRADLIRTEYFNDFMVPAGADRPLMIDLGSDGLEVCTLNIHRTAQSEDFQGTDVELAHWLHPHLIRAFKLGETFAKLHSLGDSKAAALDRLGQGVVVVDANGRILHANAAAEKIFRTPIFEIANGRLTAGDPIFARRLDALIGAAADSVMRRGGTMWMPSPNGTLSLTFAPLGAEALSLFASAPAVIITIADTRPDAVVVGQRLAEFFALTPAEIRVALALLNGATPRAAARDLDVSINTVRSQMASAFSKTGTSGQVELSKLMVGLASGL
jgi:DNA-binding CsgD family transcriptional regulator/PAS domain-containing protein